MRRLSAAFSQTRMNVQVMERFLKTSADDLALVAARRREKAAHGSHDDREDLGARTAAAGMALYAEAIRPTTVEIDFGPLPAERGSGTLWNEYVQTLRDGLRVRLWAVGTPNARSDGRLRLYGRLLQAWDAPR
jgi:hypothetical protein